MKSGKSIIELATEIERQKAARVDVLADTKALAMTEQAQLVVPSIGTMPVLESAHRQIGDRIGIPAKYYDRMRSEAPELLARNVNHWLTQQPERRLVRALDGNVRAFLSDRYQRIDNNHVAEVALPILAEVPQIEFVSTEVTDRRMYIKAVTHAVRAEIKSRRVGDFVEAGVIISNSEIGAGSLSIQPFFHFLVCTNGMVRNKEGMRAYHVGRRNDIIDVDYAVLSDTTKRLEDATTLSKVRDTLRLALDSARFLESINKIAETVEQPIKGDPVKAVEVLGDSLIWTQDERKSVLRNLITGGDLSRYGLMNAVTRTAEDLPSYDRATEFETFGGLLVDMPAKAWREVAEAE